MDGVLADSEAIGFEAMRRLLSVHGLSYTEDDDRHFRGRRNVDFFAHLRAQHGWLPSDQDLEQELTTIHTALIGERCTPMPGVPDVPQTIAGRGYAVGLASSAVSPVIAATLRAVGLDRLFAVRVSGSEVPRGKPAPDIFLEAARRLGQPPAHCLVVEDSRNGLLAAVAAGMPCAAVPCALTRDENFAEATVRLTSLPDLLPLLSPLR
jgi:beta-phosphoglucomutase-like phosphatase (HAD superfamily)